MQHGNSSLGIARFRLCSYVYDTESGLYYLQSRYYDPEIGRFINADAFASTGQGILGNNMFAYCGNNPVMFTDVAGYAFFPCNICTKGSAAGAVEQYPQEEEPSFPGTVSMGGVVGVGIGPLSVSLQIALVTDSAGVSEIQISYSAPNIFSTGLPSVDEMFDDIKSSNPKFRFGATFAGSFTFTNAPSVDNLYGPTYSVG